MTEDEALSLKFPCHVVCTNNDGWPNRLTVGKTYTAVSFVKALNGKHDLCIAGTDDRPDPDNHVWWNITRFAVSAAPVPAPHVPVKHPPADAYQHDPYAGAF